MICSDIKKEEYREINDYWTKRLVVSDAYNLLGDDMMSKSIKSTK